MQEKRKPLELTDQTFEEVANNSKVMLVSFWARWCGPSKMFTPVVDVIAGEQNNSKGIVIAKVNVDEAPIIAKKYEIKNIPITLFLKGGQLVDKVVGSTSKDILTKKLKRCR